MTHLLYGFLKIRTTPLRHLQFFRQGYSLKHFQSTVLKSLIILREGVETNSKKIAYLGCYDALDISVWVLVTVG